jgi:RNase P/RNase MRP subunit POP5
VSPRKSSTSSARPPPFRARYLAVEVAGEHLPPAFAPRWWEATLREALRAAGEPGLAIRLIRSEGTRAVVAVGHGDLARARAAWNATGIPGASVRIRTWRTWGTLVGAKAWLRRAPGRLPDAPAHGRPDDGRPTGSHRSI